jgi:hypothetical protein
MRPLLAGCVAVTVAACGSEPSAAYKSGSLSPDRWDPEASARAWQTFGAWTRDTSIETSGGGVVVDASVAPAALAGAAALDAGGSAIDAALTAALTGSVVGLGGPVTLGGIAALVYYDASSGKTYSVDGGWLVPPSEPDPGSIPVDVPSGRAILVPGFMALVESSRSLLSSSPPSPSRRRASSCPNTLLAWWNRTCECSAADPRRGVSSRTRKEGGSKPETSFVSPSSQRRCVRLPLPEPTTCTKEPGPRHW